jgi:hypothetical protein
MKKLFTLLCVLFITISLASAQITVSRSSIENGPDEWTSFSAQAPVTIDNGPAGANQSWTFDQQANVASSIQIVDPASTPFAADFPTANRCWAFLQDTTGGFSYVRLADNGHYSLGFGSNVGGIEFVASYDDEALDSPLPFNFNTPNWTRVARYTFEQSEGFVQTTVDSAISDVDGWGSVTTPHGVYDVLRLFSQIWTTITFTGLPEVTSATVGYDWITAAGIPVASSQTLDGNTNPNFTQGYVSYTTYSAQAAEPVRGPVADNFRVGQNYPNPFNPTTTLPISLQQASIVEVTIYNELGEVVSHEEFSFGPGEYTVPFDGSAWASGNYFANVKAGDVSQTKRMTLVK